MNRWLLIALNVALLGLVLFAIPVVMSSRQPDRENSQGVDALNAGDYDRAITLLSSAVEKEPDSTAFRQNLLAAYKTKAYQLSEAGQTSGALTAYETAMEMAPDDQLLLKNYVSTLNNLAVEKSNIQEFSQAQAYFERASKVLPTLGDAEVRDNIRQNYSALLTLWGTELMKRNQVSSAMDSLSQAARLDPENGVALVSLGDLAYENNDYAAAASNYSKALPVSPENSDYLKNRLQMIEDESKIESQFHQVSDPDRRFLLQYVNYRSGTTVTQVLDMLNEARDVIGRDLGVYPARAVNVKVYTPEDFVKVAKLPEWAIGIFDGKMRLRVDELQSAPTLVRDLIFHEYTHAVLAMNIKQEVPAWFHEGIAQLMEPQFRETAREREQVRVALARHDITFEKLEESFREISDKADAENAYLISKYFLTYLNRRYGHDSLRDWVKRLTQEEAFGEAFEHVYKLPLAKAQENWINSMTQD